MKILNRHRNKQHSLQQIQKKEWEGISYSARDVFDWFWQCLHHTYIYFGWRYTQNQWNTWPALWKYSCSFIPFSTSHSKAHETWCLTFIPLRGSFRTAATFWVEEKTPHFSSLPCVWAFEITPELPVKWDKIKYIM